MQSSEAASLDIRDLCKLAGDFAATIEESKARLEPVDFPWYPHNTLSALQHLNSLLTGPYRKLLGLAKGKPVLDIGCQDGELSLFLSSLGYAVHAIDYPPTNHNGMRGVRALKQALQPDSVRIEQSDLDNQFKLTGDYGLAFFLGTLYHLKNPFYVLEELSRHVDYCVVSSRVARFLPDRTTSIAAWPVAYLLTAAELNEDDSNYWILTECALRRMLVRANWTILAGMSTGATEDDERAFYLLASRNGYRGDGVLQRWNGVELIEGWHAPESTGWRWTRRRFSFRFLKPPCRSAAIRLELYIPAPALDAAAGRLQFELQCDGAGFLERTFTQPGEYVIEKQLVFGDDESHSVSFEGKLSHALPPQASDPRERGIILARIIIT